MGMFLLGSFALGLAIEKCKSRGAVLLFLRFEPVLVSTFVRDPWGPLGWVQKSWNFAGGCFV